VITSRHAQITLVERPKSGFGDVVTLHARVEASPAPAMAGTSVRLQGVTAADMHMAKSMFLVFAGEQVLEETRYGQILRRQPGPARIYVQGVVVAEESNFAFSYNITSLTEPMRKALNRERSHVGRTAYTDRVKALLLAAESREVARLLTADLTRVAQGDNFDETGWADVQVRACQVLSSSGRAVFVTASEHQTQRRFIDYAADDGLTVVTVPESVGRKLEGLADSHGQPVMGLGAFAARWQAAFRYDFIPPEQLSAAERRVYDTHKHLLAMAAPAGRAVPEVRISTTVQPTLYHDKARGAWDPSIPAIVILRSLLQSLPEFAGVLLHELAHAVSGATDVTMAFEHALTDTLGRLGAASVGAVTEGEPNEPAHVPRAEIGRQESPGTGTEPAASPVHEPQRLVIAPSEPPRQPVAAATRPPERPSEVQPAMTLEALLGSWPWIQFEPVSAGDARVIPRPARRYLSDTELDQQARTPGEWDRELRAHELPQKCEGAIETYRAERKLRELLGTLELARKRLKQ
jgi:hypothetical protein